MFTFSLSGRWWTIKANYRAALAFSDEFVWNALVGVLATLHIMGMAKLLESYRGTHPRIRWWAGASFSIYVTHYPALHLIDAIFPAETYARDGLLICGSILVGLVFAQIFERKIGSIRTGSAFVYQTLQDRSALGRKSRMHTHAS